MACAVAFLLLLLEPMFMASARVRVRCFLSESKIKGQTRDFLFSPGGSLMAAATAVPVYPASAVARPASESSPELDRLEEKLYKVRAGA